MEKRTFEDMIRSMYRTSDVGTFQSYSVDPELTDTVRAWSKANLSAKIIGSKNIIAAILSDDDNMLFRMKWAHAIIPPTPRRTQ